mmetsp:Transcript_7660/g.11376  ORF Transcript_7660/g.11376 Transcript_7660/m.11376 type:complete len:308 (-) Transcript_7660:1991-2914(-)
MINNTIPKYPWHCGIQKVNTTNERQKIYYSKERTEQVKKILQFPVMPLGNMMIMRCKNIERREQMIVDDTMWMEDTNFQKLMCQINPHIYKTFNLKEDYFEREQNTTKCLAYNRELREYRKIQKSRTSSSSNSSSNNGSNNNNKRQANLKIEDLYTFFDRPYGFPVVIKKEATKETLYFLPIISAIVTKNINYMEREFEYNREYLRKTIEKIKGNDASNGYVSILFTPIAHHLNNPNICGSFLTFYTITTEGLTLEAVLPYDISIDYWFKPEKTSTLFAPLDQLRKSMRFYKQDHFDFELWIERCLS